MTKDTNDWLASNNLRCEQMSRKWDIPETVIMQAAEAEYNQMKTTGILSKPISIGWRIKSRAESLMNNPQDIVVETRETSMNTALIKGLVASNIILSLCLFITLYLWIKL